MEIIAFIGTGIMGKPMASNLLKAGYPLVVYDIRPGLAEELEAAGAKTAPSFREAVKDADVIITMLPDSADVESVVLGRDGIAEVARQGVVLIDMISIAPLVSQRVSAELAKGGIRMLDAPVSGGEKGAIESTLAIMVGGPEDLFRQCEPILRAMGKSVVRVGNIGAGNFAKLANQIIVAINIEAVSEALVLAAKAGLDPELLYQAIRSGLAGSSVLDAKTPKILDRDFKPGFKIRLHQKDLNNALVTAKELNVSLPVTGLIQQMLTALIVDQKADCDHSAICSVIEKLAGIEVTRQAKSGTTAQAPLSPD
ncbi:MAG: 2-hydroxy-3-oxopropionate reductase [Armatimonadetes bacterium]|nr:2-hydroxy-3-oxopropionate reductase [Armatimonadota bacterium]